MSPKPVTLLTSLEEDQGPGAGARGDPQLSGAEMNDGYESRGSSTCEEMKSAMLRPSAVT